MRPSIPRRYYYTPRTDDHNYWPPLITRAADLCLMWSSRAEAVCCTKEGAHTTTWPRQNAKRSGAALCTGACRLFLLSRVNRSLWRWSPQCVTIINNTQTGLEKPYPGETPNTTISIFTRNDSVNRLSPPNRFRDKRPGGVGSSVFAHHHPPLPKFFCRYLQFISVIVLKLRYRVKELIYFFPTRRP